MITWLDGTTTDFDEHGMLTLDNPMTNEQINTLTELAVEAGLPGIPDEIDTDFPSHSDQYFEDAKALITSAPRFSSCCGAIAQVDAPFNEDGGFCSECRDRCIYAADGGVQ